MRERIENCTMKCVLCLRIIIYTMVLILKFPRSTTDVFITNEGTDINYQTNNSGVARGSIRVHIQTGIRVRPHSVLALFTDTTGLIVLGFKCMQYWYSHKQFLWHSVVSDTIKRNVNPFGTTDGR